MGIPKLTDENALELMKTHVERALDDHSVRVFQVLGYYGIGKRTAIRSLLSDRGIDPIEHDYTIIETGRPIADKIAAHPDAIHIWDDVFRSNVMHPEVLSVLEKIQDGTIQFNGTFLLVANDQEFPEQVFPPFPGVHVHFANFEVLLQHLKRQMIEQGLPETSIRHALQNTMRSMMDQKEAEDRGTGHHSEDH